MQLDKLESSHEDEDISDKWQGDRCISFTVNVLLEILRSSPPATNPNSIYVKLILNGYN